jgi:S1-C subfamily serine protease
MHSFSVRLFSAWLAAWVVLTMAACATLNNPQNPQNPQNPTTPAPENEVKRFDDSTVKLIRTYLEPRGWTYAGTNTPAAGAQWLVFVLNNSLARTGTVSRARELNVFAASSGASRPTLARGVWNQFDCTARTVQAMGSDDYSDQLATQRISSNPTPGAILPVVSNTSRDTVMSRACASQRPITAGIPGAPQRGGSGSGVVIAAGLALTNNHVVARCSSIDVLLAGQRYPARVRKNDAATDLALLEALGLPSVTPPGLRQRATIGESVMVAGFPLQGVLASDLIVTDGIVNSLSGLANNATQMQVSAPVQPGNSGGPLLDRSGNLVGLVVAKLDALRALVLTGDIPQNINFAVRPELIGRFLQSENLAQTTVEPDSRLETQKLAELARNFTLKIDCKP